MKIFPLIVARNWQLKVSAIAMAVLLWTVPEFDIQGRQVVDDVPVRIQLNDPQWARVGEPLPTTVQVTLSGPRGALMRLARPSLVVPIDQITVSDTAVLLQEQWLRMVGGEELSVEVFDPTFVRLSFEPMEVGDASAVFRLSGSLPVGLSMAREPEVSPRMVRISGPASRFQGLTEVLLDSLDLSNVTGAGTHSLAVDTSGLSGMSFSPQLFSVELFVEETEEIELPGIPLTIPPRISDPQVEASPALVTVHLSGARSLIRELDRSRVRISFSRNVAASLSPGEEARASLLVEGIPELIEARVDPEWVILRRPTGL